MRRVALRLGWARALCKQLDARRAQQTIPCKLWASVCRPQRHTYRWPRGFRLGHARACRRPRRSSLPARPTPTEMTPPAARRSIDGWSERPSSPWGGGRAQPQRSMLRKHRPHRGRGTSSTRTSGRGRAIARPHASPLVSPSNARRALRPRLRPDAAASIGAAQGPR
eukprot:scaffold1620_cov420-Prasinococcus_capsulatus_cf.AAC.2